MSSRTGGTHFECGRLKSSECLEVLGHGSMASAVRCQAILAKGGLALSVMILMPVVSPNFLMRQLAYSAVMQVGVRRGCSAGCLLGSTPSQWG